MDRQFGHRHGGEGGSLDGGAVVGMGMGRGRVKAPEGHPQACGGKRQGGGGCRRRQDWHVEAHGRHGCAPWARQWRGRIQAGGRMEGHGRKGAVQLGVPWGG